MNRNTFLQSLFALFMPVLLWAQNPSAFVHGTVTQAGAPVSGAMVYIAADSSMWYGGYTATVLTDANGMYADTILSPAGGVGVHASTADCNGGMLFQNFTYNLGVVNNFTADFQLCTGGGVGCSASFTYQGIPGSVLTQFTSTSVASNPNTPLNYMWDFGNGMTSSIANPALNLPAGTYTVCLYISDGAGCSDSTCQTVTVTGGVLGGCSASFTWTASGLTVTFDASASVGTQYDWIILNSMFSGQMLTSTFAQAGTYNVCLTVSDTSGCSNTTCQQVTVGGGASYNSIDVMVSAAAPGAFAADTFLVYLIQYDSLAGTLTAIDSATAMQGPNGGLASCSFTGLAAGDYLVKAAISTLGSPNYATGMPTYYANGLFWSVGTNVAIPSATPTSLMINMIQGANPGGQGFIGGLVSQGANKTGIPNIEILLLDMNDSPILCTYTNGSGSFSFQNLAYGTYKVYAEVLGKPTTPAIVTISAPTPSVGDVAIAINSTYVSTAIHNAIFFENTVKVYPNPATGMTTLQVELTQNTNLEVEITNMLGQVVEKRTTKLLSGVNSLSFDVKNWQSGVYFVKVSANGEQSQIQLAVSSEQ